MATIAANIQQARAGIAAACAIARRPVRCVTLLTVTKTVGPNAIREAFAAGEHRFGENYVQEGLEKIAALADLRDQIEWHLIGPLQSNKTRVVAREFDWVQSVDRLKTAQRLSEQRPAELAPLQICLQVNISGEAHKNGLAPADVLAVAQAVSQLPRLRLRGLMAIPQPDADPVQQRLPHRALRELLVHLNGQSLNLDILSMGMTADLPAAIAEGATMVRIGTAIFGSRPAPHVATG